MPISEPIARENRVIFSRGEREFTAKEVVDCAVLRGEIDPLWDEFARIGECDRLASDQGLEPDECFYLRNEPLVRGKEEIDLSI